MKMLEEKFEGVMVAYRPELILLLLSACIFLLSVGLFVLIPRWGGERDGIEVNEWEDGTGFGLSEFGAIIVDVAGAVEKPDVYEVSSGARLKDALVLARGLSVEADREFVARHLNLAQMLVDQQKIYIPTRFEVDEGRAQSTVKGVGVQEQTIVSENIGLIDINTATTDELDTLPGVGPATAQKIIEGRPYLAVQQLQEQKVVNKRVFENIADKITVY